MYLVNTTERCRDRVVRKMQREPVGAARVLRDGERMRQAKREQQDKREGDADRRGYAERQKFKRGRRTRHLGR